MAGTHQKESISAVIWHEETRHRSIVAELKRVSLTQNTQLQDIDAAFFPVICAAN